MKTIEEYPNYEINEEGEVRNKKTKKFLKLRKNSCYQLSKNGKKIGISCKKLLHMYFPKEGIFKTIEEFPNYEINEKGEVRNKTIGDFLKIDGVCYRFFNNGERTNISRKRLLHMYFPKDGIFKNIEEYPNYEINEEGEVRNKITGDFLKLGKDGCYCLYKNKEITNISKKRLLHMYFPKELPKDEIFVDIDETYRISNKGRIQNKTTGDFLKPGLNGAGYYRVELKGKLYSIHRLLAKAFIPNPQNLSVVDHIDRNPKNNSLKNLRWVTHSENIINSIKKTKYFKNIRKSKNSWRLTIKTPRCHYNKSFKMENFTLEQVKEIRNKIYEENNLPILD